MYQEKEYYEIMEILKVNVILVVEVATAAT